MKGGKCTTWTNVTVLIFKLLRAFQVLKSYRFSLDLLKSLILGNTGKKKTTNNCFRLRFFLLSNKNTSEKRMYSKKVLVIIQWQAFDISSRIKCHSSLKLIVLFRQRVSKELSPGNCWDPLHGTCLRFSANCNSCFSVNHGSTREHNQVLNWRKWQ